MLPRNFKTNLYQGQGGESSDEEELPPEEVFSCIKLLVENGGQVNEKDTMGLTPLHYACTRGNTEAVKELINCVGIALEVSFNDIVQDQLPQQTLSEYP